MLNGVIGDMMDYNGGDIRRVDHALKVLGFALAIAEEEGQPEEVCALVGLAAVLHDIGIHEAERKHGSAAGPWQELEGPPIARCILEARVVAPSVVDRICHLVGNHHSYQNIDGVDFQILVEADFLVNAHEDGMDRQAVESVKQKLFRTTAGTRMLERLYLS